MNRAKSGLNPHGKKCECAWCFDNGFGAIQYVWED
jgi:hypothetical protein